MTKNINPQPGDTIEAFVSIIDRGLKILAEEGAAMLVRLCHKDPDTINKIRALRPTLPENFLIRVLRIGEGSLPPDMLYNNTVPAMTLNRMPKVVQEKVAKTGTVDLVVNADTGDMIKVPVALLTRPQLKQVFSTDNLRSADEQRAFMKRTSLTLLPTQAKGVGGGIKWKVQGEVILITKPYTMTIDRHTLQTMLQGLDRKVA
jgi:hypothetical protein